MEAMSIVRESNSSRELECWFTGLKHIHDPNESWDLCWISPKAKWVCQSQ